LLCFSIARNAREEQVALQQLSNVF
jgi:hypothetical protein